MQADAFSDAANKLVIQQETHKVRFRQVAEADFSDPSFLERLKRRDHSALDELVGVYLQQLLRTGLGMGFSREESEDLAQATFLALLGSLQRFEGRSHIRTFLFGIFYNKVSEHLRHKQRELQTDSIDEQVASRFDSHGNWSHPPVDIENALYGQEVKVLIQNCLDGIPREQRAVFYLREVEELTTSEICEKMGVSISNFGVLLFRARNRLRECLEKKLSAGKRPGKILSAKSRVSSAE